MSKRASSRAGRGSLMTQSAGRRMALAALALVGLWAAIAWAAALP